MYDCQVGAGRPERRARNWVKMNQQIALMIRRRKRMKKKRPQLRMVPCGFFFFFWSSFWSGMIDWFVGWMVGRLVG